MRLSRGVLDAGALVATVRVENESTAAPHAPHTLAFSAISLSQEEQWGMTVVYARMEICLESSQDEIA